MSTGPVPQNETRIAHLAILVAWCAVLFGLSNLHKLHLGHFSGLCGRWGCLAATASLLGIHLVWLLVLSTAVIAAIRWKPASQKWLCRGLIGCGVLLTVGISTAAAIHWNPVGIGEWTRLMPFAVISETDFPSLQCLIVGFGVRFGFLTSASKMPVIDHS